MPVGHERAREFESTLPWALLGAVVVEFLLLRTGTRALIHIPGLGRFEAPIRVLAELGRFFYYLAVVVLMVTLATMAVRRVRSGVVRDSVLGTSILLFVALALAGRAGLVSVAVVGWSSLAVVAAAAALTGRGFRSIPIVLFALSSVVAGWSVLGQGDGGGLSGSTVDWLVLSAETLLVLAAISSPLIVARRLSVASLTAGAVAAVLVAGAMAAGGSTLSIIILWNIGVPGWLPWIAYALAIGGLTTSVWLSAASSLPMTAIGIVLLVAGGVGVISTYQTALVLAGLLLIAGEHSHELEMEGSDSADLLDPLAVERVAAVGG